MLKTFRGLILGLVVLVGSAYVTPTYASSASILITEIHPGTPQSALEEIVVLYNQSAENIDVTGWCLFNKLGKEFGCLESEVPNERVRILPYGYALIVSTMQEQLIDQTFYAIAYTPTHASNGSIVGSSDTITLVNLEGVEVDSFSWTSLSVNSLYWQRISTPYQDRRLYHDTDQPSNWFTGGPSGKVLEQSTPGFEWYMDIPPVEPDPEPDPDPVPDLPSDPEPEESLPAMLRINELLPNAAGSDDGNEFIEIVNSGILPASLADYTLLVGKSLEKSYVLPNVVLAPSEYVVLRNSDIAFTLLNTTSRVALAYNGQIIDEVEYSDPKDDHAWARIDDIWQYVKPATPGVENVLPVVTDINREVVSEPELKPCAAHQERNPETNRCRNIEAQTVSLSPCREGQERNPETNRCRNVETESTTLAPCKEGQERNPETNRCRNIVQMTETDHGVLGIEEQPQQASQWYLLIIGIVALIIGLSYVVIEWQDEIREGVRRLIERFRRADK